jgi:preprotein translocase subunit SecY
MALRDILNYIPEVKHPTEKKLSFNKKLIWTIIILSAFFILSNISLYALSANSLERFQYLALLLGADFGSIISLGIGPIVMASIILQLLVGSGIIKIDTNTSEGKKLFQGIQKVLVLAFIFFEAIIYVFVGGLQPIPGYAFIVILQLILGGLAIMYMDEVTSKWGLGSGVSLFIVAGVALSLFSGLVQFITTDGSFCSLTEPERACSGQILVLISSLISNPANLTGALVALSTILATALIFLTVVWAQSLKVEIPLSYERLRGYGIKWPLAFFYASNIPVILTAALVANIQLFGGMLQNAGKPWLGEFSNGVAVSGIAYWLGSSNIVEALIRGSLQSSMILQGIIHLIFFMGVSALFAVMWVKTSGMDESSQAKKIMSSGLQIPGFRKDQRVLESVLKRYIMPLTIMGGLAVGALAAIANSLGAIAGGTAILLAVMITYQLYQNIAQQHAVDMHPALKKIVS